jgi:protein-tyrosine phosphatase
MRVNPFDAEVGVFRGCFSTPRSSCSLRRIKFPLYLWLQDLTFSLTAVDIEHDDVKYLNVDVLDMANQNIKKHFEKCFKFIEGGRRDGVVLVHCNAGVSRAPTICVAYLMKKLKISYDDAFELVKDARPAIEPNPGFTLQLKEYYFDLHPEQRTSTIPTVSHVSNPPMDPVTAPLVISEPTRAAPHTFLPTDAESPTTEPPAVELPAEDIAYYTCRVCRFRVFGADEVVPHEPGKHEFSYRRREYAAGYLASPLWILTIMSFTEITATKIARVTSSRLRTGWEI